MTFSPDKILVGIDAAMESFENVPVDSLPDSYSIKVEEVSPTKQSEVVAAKFGTARITYTTTRTGGIIGKRDVLLTYTLKNGQYKVLTVIHSVIE